jgi:hypothetical protein
MNVIKVSPVWTTDLVARRAFEFAQFRHAVRAARGEYHAVCAKYRSHALGGAYIDREDPKFRRATRKTYLALQDLLRAERNALRRLETAVRNCADLSEVH